MTTIDIEQLKLHVDEVLREVVGRGASVEITQGGETVAQIAPLTRQSAGEDDFDVDAYLSEIDAFANRLAKDWPEGVSAVDAVREVRRDL